MLLTDTDVAYLQNPFPYLYRDSDIESMSDGWDNSSAHGQGFTLVPISAQLELTLPLCAQLKLTLSPV